MKNRIKVLFWLRPIKSKGGKLKVYYYVTVNGERSSAIATGISCEKADFDSETQTIKSSQLETEMLKSIAENINKKRLWFESNNQETNLADFMLFGEKAKAKYVPALGELIQEYYQYECDRGKLGDATIKTYKLRFNNVTAYLKAFGFEKSNIATVNKVWAWKMLSYITTNEGRNTNKKGANSNSYASRHVLLLNKAINYAKSMGYVTHNELDGFDYIASPKKAIVHLTADERTLLYMHKFAAARLQQCADIYTLMCHTGMDAIDVAVFDVKINMHKDLKGRYWISGKRQKNGQHFIVPVSKESYCILQKYLGANLADCKNLPVLCNAKFNTYLKEIADILGINKRLTTKVSRRTFATLMINDYQISKDVVAKMLGHASVKTLEVNYADVLEYRIANEIETKLEIFAA